MPNCLTSRSVLPVLDCFFLYSRRNWIAATRRHPGTQSGVAFRRVDSVSCLMDPFRIKSGSVVFVEIPVADVSDRAILAMIWKLTQRRIHVVVAGNERENEVLSKSLIVGAASVVTKEEDCDKVARLIEAAKRQQIPEFVDWKEDILRCLPWPRYAAHQSDDPAPGN